MLSTSGADGCGLPAYDLRLVCRVVERAHNSSSSDFCCALMPMYHQGEGREHVQPLCCKVLF